MGSAREAGGGVMGNRCDASDPSGAVRHLPGFAGEEIAIVHPTSSIVTREDFF
jgi:hypothetical protein